MRNANFRTKVLVPVIVVMALLVAISMWLFNHLVKEQIRSRASEQLNTAEEVLKVTQLHRADELLLRYKNVANEPRVKAFATSEFFSGGQVQFEPEQVSTLLNFLNYLIQEGLCDAVALTPRNEKSLIQARDAQFNKDSFQENCSNSVAAAFQNQSVVETIQNGNRLFDVVTIPIVVGDTNSPSIFGALTFAVENTLPKEFYNLTQSRLYLISRNQTNAPPADDLGFSPQNLFEQTIGKSDEIEQKINNERFLCRAGWLNGQLGYLILFSDEKPLQILESMQRKILLIGFVAVVFVAGVILFLISRVTRPLLELRDSAEAVGRGDFSHRVTVRSRDECGELAVAFNRMTENVQQSRAQLEQTVATLKSTQEQLIQSEKLSAVGEFVAGVAHELNNPLAAVMGFSEMLREADVDAKYRRQLDFIFKAAQRCQKIVQSLLSFARRQKPERKPVSVNELVEAVLEIVAYPLRTSNVEVITQLDKKLPIVFADGHQIQQVLLNIVNNARQAIEGQPDGGQIKIATEMHGANARINISDNGPGISEENLRRIFDPFFTTKEVGKGTGLGLSLCYGIIREHGGSITASSKRGKGATFVIELPIVEGVKIENSNPPASQKIDAHEGAGKKVLVIDDEEPILQLVQQVLSANGYHVHTVADGETALRKLKENHCDIIFCDWKMPGLSGRQIYERLRVENPQLCPRFIFITGDVINETMREFLEKENRPCLTKPFALDDLRGAIKTILPPQL